MMKIKILLLLFSFLTFAFINTKAAPTADKVKARAVIIKSNNALGIAHMTVKRTKKYTGKLGKAIKHERFAIKQYKAGNFDKSIYHAFYARKLAAEIMAENNAKTNTLFLFAPDEKALQSSSPSDEDLSKEANADDPTEIKDEDLMGNGTLGLETP
jgi:hypothetical protein